MERTGCAVKSALANAKLAKTSFAQEKGAEGDVNTLEVTHPFHPLRGRVLSVASGVAHSAKPMMHCYADADTLCSIPVAWTSRRQIQIDDFERISAGRALFRPDDLKRLRARVDALLYDQEYVHHVIIYYCIILSDPVAQPTTKCQY